MGETQTFQPIGYYTQQLLHYFWTDTKVVHLFETTKFSDVLQEKIISW